MLVVEDTNSLNATDRKSPRQWRFIIATVGRAILILRSGNLSASVVQTSVASVLASSFMFLFWMVVTRLYSPSEVGRATVALAGASLVVSISTLGVGIALMRYGSRLGEDFGPVLTASYVLVSLTTVLFAIVAAFTGFVKGIPPVGMVAFALALALVSLQDSALRALRKNAIVMLRTLFISIVRLVTIPLILLLGVHSAGPVWALGTAGLATIVLTEAYLTKTLLGTSRYGIRGFRYLRNLVSFALLNHVGNLLMVAPTQIVPILIAHIMSNTEAGAYYLSYSIASIIYLIPVNAASMLLPYAAGSMVSTHDSRQLRYILYGLSALVLLLIPVAPLSLYLLGPTYAQTAANVLRILLFATLPMISVRLYLTLLRLWMDNTGVLLLSATQASLGIGAAAVGGFLVGLDGAALGILAGQVLTLMCAVLHARYKGYPIGWLWFEVGGKAYKYS